MHFQIWSEFTRKNFLLHLKRKHKHARHDYDEAKKAKKDTQSIDRFVPKTPMIMKKCNQEDASKLITNLIVKCALPLSLVEKDPFKDLVKKLLVIEFSEMFGDDWLYFGMSSACLKRDRIIFFG